MFCKFLFVFFYFVAFQWWIYLGIESGAKLKANIIIFANDINYGYQWLFYYIFNSKGDMMRSANALAQNKLICELVLSQRQWDNTLIVYRVK